MSVLITGEPTPEVDIEKGIVTCRCGHEFAANKFYAHLIFFGFVACQRCGREFRESRS